MGFGCIIRRGENGISKNCGNKKNKGDFIMELLKMDNLKESHKKFIDKHLREFNDIEKANELIKFFSRSDVPSNWAVTVIDGYLGELNAILNG